MNELQQLRLEIQKAIASSSIDNLKLIQTLYNTIVEEFQNADSETMQAIKADIANLPEPKDGEKGDTGKDGADGKQGKTGKNGKEGKKGKDGKDGKDGTDGKDGKDSTIDDIEDVIEAINEAEGTIEQERVEGLPEIQSQMNTIVNNTTNITTGGGGATSFYNLQDTPANYSDDAGKVVTVNSTEDGLIFSTAASATVLTLAIKTVTTNYTATAADSTILVDATSGTVTVTLPTAVGIQGRIYTIKKIDSSINNVIIDGNGSETIDDGLTATIQVQYISATPQSNNINWNII